MNHDTTPLAADGDVALRRIPAGARHARILGLVNRNGFVSVSEIAESFAVSDMTIRRDLWALEDKGMLQRTHGGAVGIGRREVFDGIVERGVRMSPAQEFEDMVSQRIHGHSATISPGAGQLTT